MTAGSRWEAEVAQGGEGVEWKTILAGSSWDARASGQLKGRRKVRAVMLFTLVTLLQITKRNMEKENQKAAFNFSGFWQPGKPCSDH